MSDVVIKAGAQSPRTQWSLGVVREVFPNRDGLFGSAATRLTQSAVWRLKILEAGSERSGGS